MYLYLIYLFKKDPDAQERCQQGYLYLVGLRTSPGLPARFETMLQNRPQIWGSQTMDWIGRLPLDGKDGLCGVRLEKPSSQPCKSAAFPFNGLPRHLHQYRPHRHPPVIAVLRFLVPLTGDQGQPVAVFMPQDR